MRSSKYDHTAHSLQASGLRTGERMKNPTRSLIIAPGGRTDVSEDRLQLDDHNASPSGFPCTRRPGDDRPCHLCFTLPFATHGASRRSPHCIKHAHYFSVTTPLYFLIPVCLPQPGTLIRNNPGSQGSSSFAPTYEEPCCARCFPLVFRRILAFHLLLARIQACSHPNSYRIVTGCRP